MNVLVTGGCGYIGSHVVRMLIDAGHCVGVIDGGQDRNAIHKLCPVWSSRIDEFIRYASIQDLGMDSVDVVIHLAASAIVSESVDHPAAYWQNNVCDTADLLRFMTDEKIKRLVFASSCAVYGLATADTLDEDHPLRPINPYGNTKVACEAMIGDYCRAYGLGAISLRLFNVAGSGYGYGEFHDPETHLVPCLLDACQTGNAFRLAGADFATDDGTAERDYVHVMDVARAFLLALGAVTPSVHRIRHRCYNIGSGYASSVLDAVTLARNITQRELRIARFPPRPGDPPRLVPNIDWARRYLGWSPTLGLRDIVSSAWLAKQSQSEQPVSGQVRLPNQRPIG